MEIENLFNQISFKIKPEDNYRKAYLFRLYKMFYKLLNKEKEFEFKNCKIKTGNESEKLKKALLQIDSMSTYATGHLINQICKKLKNDQLYLNIGCWKGFSLIAGMIETNCQVIGVDNFSEFGGPKETLVQNFNKYKNIKLHKFYELDYIDFFNKFEKEKKSINFYFYDGEHSYKNQYENLILVDQFLANDAIIMIDDINFIDVENASKDFVSKYSKNYKILREIKTANNHCHPSYWNGLMFIKKNF